MAEHDQRFKQLLQEFLPEFLLLFFPQRAQHLDLGRIEWLDKEIFPDPSQAEVYQLDLVARLRYRAATLQAGAEALALVHIEVESRDAVASFRRRMYQYYESLRRKYGLPVLPVAVYLRVGLEGIGVDTYVEAYEDLEVLRFQFHYLGLPALDAEQYVGGGNWLGVALAALMRVPAARRAWLRGEALRRVLLECRESEYRRFLLRECVEAYLDLNERQRQEYEQLLQTEPYREIGPMMTTTYEKGKAEGRAEGRAQGREEGRAEGVRLSVRLLLERRFGTLSPAVLQRLEAWPADRLEELLLAVPGAVSLHDLQLEQTA
jgi:hypothetical protein